MKARNKFAIAKPKKRVRRTKKKIKKEKLRQMSIEEFIAVLEGYTNEIYNHVDLEQQMDGLTLNLTQLHDKMDNYLTEISKLKIEREKRNK
jgi:hypothetical protein